MIVELCGVSGAGKSTIYRAMLTEGAGRFVPNPKPSFSRSRQIVAGGAKQYRDINEFSGLLGRLFDSARGPMLRARRGHTFRSLAKVVMNRSDASGGVMVVDGGLVQRAQGIARLDCDVTLDEYYRALPSPHLLVMVSADADAIIERNKARGGRHDRSADVYRSLEIHNQALAVMDERNVPVMVIDASLPPQENARRILGAMETLWSAAA